MGDFYWLWDKLENEWTVGERSGTRWRLLGTDGTMGEDEFGTTLIMGEQLEPPTEPPLHV